MKTVYTGQAAAWRAKRFSKVPADSIYLQSPQAKAIAQIYDGLADNPAVGVAATEAMKKDSPTATAVLESVDVAAAWMARLTGTAASGPINNTGMFKAVAGEYVGAALENIYQGRDIQGDSIMKTSVGIGEDWGCPAYTVSSDGTSIRIGLRPKAGTPDTREKFDLAVPDPTK